MRFPLSLSLLALTVLLSACGDGNFLSGFSPELKDVERKLEDTRLKLEALGEPMVSRTVPQFGYMTNSPHFRPPTEDPNAPQWVQVDLGETYAITEIVLIPVQIDWHLLLHPTYNFPRRFRVELSDDGNSSAALPLIDSTGEDFPAPGIFPVIVPAHQHRGRFVRVTVTSPEPFALAELMVLNGNRNIAIGCPVAVSGSAIVPPRWDAANLVDGRMPIGPPILFEPSPYDGLYAGAPPDDSQPVWIQLDLGRELTVEEVRLYPIHGRMGIDSPGYSFPLRFRVELASEPGFTSPTVAFESTGPYSNPGNNVVTIPVRYVKARYVRMVLVEPFELTKERRFGLSEIEVYVEGQNVARQAQVETVEDSHPSRAAWPKSLLVDGHTSFGRIVELPEWLHTWTRRKELDRDLEALNRRQVTLLAEASRRQWLLMGGLGTLFFVGIIALTLNMQRLRKRELALFRRQLAHDLHDEIGSNLAAIGLISETAALVSSAPAAGYCKKINQIARETTDAMRETLWLAGFKEKIGLNLMEHLQATATRILTGKKVEWTSVVEALPPDWPMDDRRQIFLFFKEALANIVRHSQADTVTLSASIEDGCFKLEVRDNGRGFELKTWSGGVGLDSLQSRAARLGGTVQIDTAPENGTRVILRAKLKR